MARAHVCMPMCVCVHNMSGCGCAWVGASAVRLHVRSALAAYTTISQDNRVAGNA